MGRRVERATRRKIREEISTRSLDRAHHVARVDYVPDLGANYEPGCDC
jgi:hypothetical protein